MQNLISFTIVNNLEYLIIKLPQLIRKHYNKANLEIELNDETTDKKMIKINIITNYEHDLDTYDLIKSFLNKHYDFELSKNIQISLNFKNKLLKEL